MAAREVSVDFAMRGDSEAMNLAYHTIMFLKAGMNSLDRVYRGGFKDASRAHVWAAAGTPHAVFPIAPGRLLDLSGGSLADIKEG